jgi:hypothetical protein
MITNEEAKSLLEMEKHLENKKQYFDSAKEKVRFDLVSKDREYKFLLQIQKCRKIDFKATFHHQEKEMNLGLIRVDFKGAHTNPDVAEKYVPDEVKKYAGEFFNNIPHIHFYIEGYKPLSWAIPLVESDFPVKEISSEYDFYKAVDSFGDYIKLLDRIRILGAITK